MTDARYARRRDAEVIAALRGGYVAERGEDGYYRVVREPEAQAPSVTAPEPRTAPTDPSGVQRRDARRDTPGRRRN